MRLVYFIQSTEAAVASRNLFGSPEYGVGCLRPRKCRANFIVMEIIRISRKIADFTCIDNGISRDPDLSLQERGLMLTVLSLPDSWEFNIQGLAAIVRESKPTIAKIIHGLIAHGYCTRERVVDPQTKRVTKWEYTFYEVKNGAGCDYEPQSKKPQVENPQCGKPTSGKVSTIKYYKESNTNKSNTKNINTKAFDFLEALKSIGVSESVARDWLAVRKTKRATNTKTAFERIKAEIAKSGRSADECIRTAAEKSWQGFQADWMPRVPERRESWEDYKRNHGLL